LSYDKKNLPGFIIKEKDTPIIYLNKNLEEILKSFNHTARNEIRKTLNNKIIGLRFVSDDHDLVGNYRLSAEFEKSQGRRPDNISDYQGCKIFSAYYHDELIANVICFDIGSILRAKVICSKRLKADQQEKRRIISYAGRRLMYEVCRYGIEHGYKIYDLGSNKLFPLDFNYVKDIISHLKRNDFKSKPIPLWDSQVAKRIFDNL